jgi:hypothetical protein
MKRSSYSLGGLALALLFAVPTAGRADLIAWSYNWSRSPSEIHADAPGTGYITLTDESMKNAVGNSDIVATNLKTYSSATIANKDLFTAKPYSLTLNLQDVESGKTASLTFTGKIDGWLTSHSSFLRNTFTGQVTQFVDLGTNRYTVTINGYTPPGVPGSSNSGSISAKATVSVTAIVAEVPEPATLTLSGVSLLVFAGVARGRRQRRREAA